MRRTAALLASLPWCAIAFAQQAVVSGPGNDYQASVAVPWQQPQQRVLVFERLDASFSGDLWLTRSDDGGDSWSILVSVVATSGNEHHAALVQTGEKAWSLFHLSNASGGYRIHRATSADGETFSPSSPIDLGWVNSGEINPYMIRQPDDSLLLTYHRLGGASSSAVSSSASMRRPLLLARRARASLPTWRLAGPGVRALQSRSPALAALCCVRRMMNVAGDQ
ncbi:sialidase family protein [Denitratimonas sp. CY0512]|uniref:sialidase family protein n=1 Tax=Denitratimonas sp. CY0512 TaxID=3131940 RepID=UPI0030B3B6C2